MAEPLTKDKIGKSVEDFDTISVKDLKSALEEFEKLCIRDLNNNFLKDEWFYSKDRDIGILLAIGNMKKAFPAIYEKEEKE